MKILKLTLLIIGLIGILASLYNIYIEETLNGNKFGLICSAFLIYISFRTNSLESYIEAVNVKSNKN